MNELKMTGMQYLPFLWTLFIIQTGSVCSDVQFLEKQEGESVVLPCAVEHRSPSPYGVYLKRDPLQPVEILFMHTKSEFSMDNSDDKKRTSVRGDPRNHYLNVTISQLRVSDAGRYYCEFVVNNPNSEDERIPGKTEFFLLVHADALGSLDIDFIETCAGGSVTIPCAPPQGERSALESVNVKRQRGHGRVEVLYHLNHDHSGSTVSQFPVEKVHLSLAPGPGGITYNVTLQQLQPDDSALYSCQLLVHGRSTSITSLGRPVFFVSVQGDQCSCSSYSTLLYALFSSVAVLILLVLIGVVVIYQDKVRSSVKSQPHQAPIYEEMTGVQRPTCKQAPSLMGEMESSEDRHCNVKQSRPENYYERPRGAMRSETELK